MWLMIVWSLFNDSVIPSNVLISTSQEECNTATKLINERSIMLPTHVVGASCVLANSPST